jgi:hypothetical protein
MEIPTKLNPISLARSEDIDLYQITMTKDSAHPFLVELGTHARCLQFIDLNRHTQSFKLPHTLQIKQCEETLIKLNNLLDLCK